MSGESMLTVNEVADRMAVQAATVRGWIKARALGSVKISARGTRVTEGALREFVAGRTVRAVTAGKIAPRRHGGHGEGERYDQV